MKLTSRINEETKRRMHTMSPDIHRVPQRPAFDSLIPFELSPFVPPADEYYNGP